MKAARFMLSFIFFGCLCTGCNHVLNHQIKAVSTQIPATAIKGDFDGDGIQDFAWLVPPPLSADSMSCQGKCTSYIKFSGDRLQPIAVDDCIGGTLKNLGDLNSKSGDEIGLLPDWFTSCWRTYHVYSYEQNKWVYAVPPFPVHCNTFEEPGELIQQDPAKNGNVIIRYSENTGGSEIVTKTKSEAIN